PSIGKRGDHLVVYRGAPPGNAQILDVVAIDLIEGGVASEPLVAAVVAPFGSRRGGPGLGRLRRNDRNGGRNRADGEDGESWLGVCHGSIPLGKESICSPNATRCR